MHLMCCFVPSCLVLCEVVLCCVVIVLCYVMLCSVVLYCVLQVCCVLFCRNKNPYMSVASTSLKKACVSDAQITRTRDGRNKKK